MSSKPPGRRATLVITPEIIDDQSEPTLILPQNFETELQNRDAEVDQLHSEIMERNQELIRLNKTVVDLQCVMSQLDHGIHQRDDKIERLQALLRIAEEGRIRRDEEITRLQDQLKEMEESREFYHDSYRKEFIRREEVAKNLQEANKENNRKLEEVQKECLATVIQKREAMERELELHGRLDGYLREIKALEKELEELRPGKGKERQSDEDSPRDLSVLQGERVKLDTNLQIEFEDLPTLNMCMRKESRATKISKPQPSSQDMDWRKNHRAFKKSEPQPSTDNMLALRMELTAIRNPEMQLSVDNMMVLRRECRASIKPEPQLSVQNMDFNRALGVTKNPVPQTSTRDLNFGIELKAIKVPEPEPSLSKSLKTVIPALRSRHQLEASKVASQSLAPLSKENLASHTSHVEAIRRKLELMRTRNEEPVTRLSKWVPAVESKSKDKVVPSRMNEEQVTRLPKLAPAVPSESKEKVVPIRTNEEPATGLSNWVTAVESGSKDKVVPSRKNEEPVPRLSKWVPAVESESKDKVVPSVKDDTASKMIPLPTKLPTVASSSKDLVQSEIETLRRRLPPIGDEVSEENLALLSARRIGLRRDIEELVKETEQSDIQRPRRVRAQIEPQQDDNERSLTPAFL
ncbi:hypothetical protein FPQ18DRAFT_303848 [Pyronema domesticum]|nr:hypothetical protein FPQ18DRAFT_303848 [Pyronema domesticum]